MPGLTLDEEYQYWLLNLISSSGVYDQLLRTHRKVIDHLDSVPFTYDSWMDENRSKDGRNLRSIFIGEVFDIRDSIERESFGVPIPREYIPTTVLEVMIALAIRMENEYMANDIYGDRIPEWFWGMIESLGLLSEDDSNYSVEVVNEIIDSFLEKRYGRDGFGSLFCFPGCYVDSSMDIWSQMLRYVSYRISQSR